MNIITTQNFVAGIFADWTDAQNYLALKPPEIKGFVHVVTDLEYPFYLLEVDGWHHPASDFVLPLRFVGFQTEAEARAQGTGIILYTIREDYQPDQPWMDSMGILPHDHLMNDDDD